MSSLAGGRAQVFISHAMGADGGTAQRLASDLRKHGYDVWIAPDSIHPSEEWVSAIERGLDSSQFFIVLLSREAVESKWVKLEMNAAINLERSSQLRILPLQITVCEIPTLWRAYQAIPFQIYSTGLISLLQSLQSSSIVTSASNFKIEFSWLNTLYAPGGVSSLTFSLEGELITGTRNGRVQVWTISGGQELSTFIAHEKPLTDVALSPLENLLATSSSDNSVRLWSWPECHQVGTLDGHEGTVTSVDFSPSGELLVSGSRDSTARVWMISERKTIRVLGRHSKSVYGVAFSPNGKLIASVSSDNTVVLWSVNEDFEDEEIGKPAQSTLLRVVFSPDGETLATGAWGGEIRLWNIVERESAGILEGHRDRVYGLNFSPDGATLASGSKDGYLRLWNMPGRDLAYPPVEAHGGWLRSLAFSTTGNFLATGDSDGVIKLWELRRVVS